MSSQLYRDWLIVPIEQEDHWLWAISAPGREVFLDYTPYTSPEAALAAARESIDRHTAGRLLIQCLETMYQERKLQQQEFDQLVNSLVNQCF